MQYFPFKSLSMLFSLFTIVSMSKLTDYLFTEKLLPVHYDIFQCIVNLPPDRYILKENSSFAPSTDTIHLAHLKIENGGATNPMLLNANSHGSFNVIKTPESDERLPLNSPQMHQGNHQTFTYESVLKD